MYLYVMAIGGNLWLLGHQISSDRSSRGEQDYKSSRTIQNLGPLKALGKQNWI